MKSIRPNDAHTDANVISELRLGKPAAINLDNGPEKTSHTFVDRARDLGVQLIITQPGKPKQNAFIERFNRSFRTEVLVACLFDSVDQVQAQADAWLAGYNEQRPP